MATPKPKKSGKKPAGKPETVKESKEVKAPVKKTEVVTAPAAKTEKPLAGFFAKKCDKDENIVTIFKTPKIWGALIGELMGTMLLAILFIALGSVSSSPLSFWIPVVAIYAITVSLSGAHLNPVVTAGAMATRRVSAIRGILYMLAQLLGAWLALILLNAFRLGSETSLELPVMAEMTGETFWSVALVELVGAAILAYCFARSLKFARKQPLAFGGVMAGALILVLIFGAVVGSSYFNTGNSYMFNPVIALMHQILPTTADSFGELMGTAGLALAAYVLVPVIGGILGFFLSDAATRLAADGYECEVDKCCGAHTK